jgi:hypothetical protein
MLGVGGRRKTLSQKRIGVHFVAFPPPNDKQNQWIFADGHQHHHDLRYTITSLNLLVVTGKPQLFAYLNFLSSVQASV